MILADTSAWVELGRSTGSPVNRRMRELVSNDDGQLAVTEPVLAELVAGARTMSEEQEERRLLGRFALLPFLPTSDFDIAARIYQDCRRAGVSPRGLYDCQIAAVAWRTDSTLLVRDVDLVRIAEIIGIELDQP